MNNLTLETRKNIISFLDISDIRNVLNTSKDFRIIYLQMHFWKELFYRDYNPLNPINQYFINNCISLDGWLKIYKYNTLKIKYKKHNIHI